MPQTFDALLTEYPQLLVGLAVLAVFLLSSAAFALVLPLWAPIAALDTAGYIGPLPIIRTQLVLLSVLAAAVSYMAFRERTYRYSAAMLLAYATLEGEQRKDRA